MFSLAFSMTSCLEQYSIVGNTSLPMLDGKTLYLKNRTLQGVKNIDSCEVIHGQFTFDGKIDSTFMAELYLDNVSVMPVVIENGKISVDINLLDQKVSGSSLNDKLYRFIDAKSRLDSELGNTSLEEARLMMRGVMPFDPYVKEYMAIARKNMAIINGKDCVEKHDLPRIQDARILHVKK